MYTIYFQHVTLSLETFYFAQGLNLITHNEVEMNHIWSVEDCLQRGRLSALVVEKEQEEEAEERIDSLDWSDKWVRYHLAEPISLSANISFLINTFITLPG